MSNYFDSYLDEQLDILEEWDVDALVAILRISNKEILEVPEFQNRAIEWIKENCVNGNTN